MFWVRLFERMRLKRKKRCLFNQPLITSFNIKMYLFFAELAMSQRRSAIFCATGAWGGKPIGRVRVNSHAIGMYSWVPWFLSNSLENFPPAWELTVILRLFFDRNFRYIIRRAWWSDGQITSNFRDRWKIWSGWNIRDRLCSRLRTVSDSC